MCSGCDGWDNFLTLPHSPCNPATDFYKEWWCFLRFRGTRWVARIAKRNVVPCPNQWKGPRISGSQDISTWGSGGRGIPASHDPGIPGSEDSRFPGSQHPRIWGYQDLKDPRIPASQDVAIPGSQDPRMSGSQDLRIPLSQDPRIPGSQYALDFRRKVGGFDGVEEEMRWFLVVVWCKLGGLEWF